MPSVLDIPGAALRPYQDKAVHNTLDALHNGLDPMVVMATGLGKTPALTTVGKMYAERTKTRTLFLVHRSELADQIEDWLARIDPEHHAAREQGESEVLPGLWENRYVVAMVQSISQVRRLKRYNPKEFGLIVTDESHHGKADQWQKIYEHFLNGNPLIRRVGFSACWTDSSGKALGRQCGYNHIAFQFRVREAIREGWLVPVKAAGVPIDGIDWGKLPDLEDIDEIVEQEGPIHKLVKTMIELAGDRQTLVFCGRKKQVRAVNAMINRPGYRPGSSRHITDEDGRDPIRRRNLAQDFRSGLFQTLVNAGIYTEGTDFPNVSCVVIARPCQSEPLAVQCVGRGLRPAPGVLDDPSLWEDTEGRLRAIAQSAKRDCLVLDFCLKVAGRKLLTVHDVLGDEYSPQVREYAKRIQPEDSAPEDVIETLDRAEAEWALIQEEVARRALVACRSVSYRTEECDLFDPRIKALPSPSSSTPREPATSRQVGFLIKALGWSEAMARSMSKRQASGIIAKHIKKESQRDMDDPIAVPVGGDNGE